MTTLTILDVNALCLSSDKAKGDVKAAKTVTRKWLIDHLGNDLAAFETQWETDVKAIKASKANVARSLSSQVSQLAKVLKDGISLLNPDGSQKTTGDIAKERKANEPESQLVNLTGLPDHVKPLASRFDLLMLWAIAAPEADVMKLCAALDKVRDKFTKVTTETK
jgi:hypothetical protein